MQKKFELHWISSFPQISSKTFQMLWSCIRRENLQKRRQQFWNPNQETWNEAWKIQVLAQTRNQLTQVSSCESKNLNPSYTFGKKRESQKTHFCYCFSKETRVRIYFWKPESECFQSQKLIMPNGPVSFTMWIHWIFIEVVHWKFSNTSHIRNM